MQTLPADLLSMIVVFQPLFTKPTWENARMLLLGVLLTIPSSASSDCFSDFRNGQGAPVSSSIGSKRDQRVHLCRPPRRNPASQQGDDQQQQRNGGKRNRVHGVHAKEQALHQPCQSQRRYKAQNKTDGNQPQALSENEIHNVVGLRAKRQAKAEFILALRDAVSHHAVNSRRRKQQRQAAKESEQD